MAKRKKFTETLAQELDNMPEVIKIETPEDIETREVEEGNTPAPVEEVVIEEKPVIEEVKVEEKPKKEVKKTKKPKTVKNQTIGNPKETMITDQQTSSINYNLWNTL